MDITALDVQYEDVQNNGAGPPELTVTDSSPMAAEARVLGRDSPDAVRFTIDTKRKSLSFSIYGFTQYHSS